MHDRINSQSSRDGAQPAVILHCLGSFRLSAADDGADLSPRGRKARALVAYLALNGGPVSRERLAGLLWGERGEEQARASLRNTLLELRALSSNGHSALQIEREHVGVISGRIATDMEQLLAWAANGNLAAIDEGLASWDGRIFADLDSIDAGFDDWLGGERTRQQQKLFAALTTALEAALSGERVEHVRSIADKLLQIEPTNEVIVRLAMRADQAARDVSAIRRRFKRLENELRAEFKAAPSADTRRLYDDLVAGSGVPPDLDTAAPSIGNGQVEHEASDQTAPAPPPPASKRAGWQWAAAAVIVAVVGAVTLAVTGSYEWRPRQAADVVELRALVAPDEKPEVNALAKQTHGTLRRFLASHQVPVIDGGATPSAERSTAPEFTLTGSVENAGTEISVTLYLENIGDGQTLWSHRFTRPMAEREELRDEIGAHTAFKIGCALRQRRLAHVKPTVAQFKIYLELCDPAFVWPDESFLAIAQRLVEVAPSDPYGHGLVAVANAIMGGRPGLSAAEIRTFRDRAHRAASRALQLDPTSSLPPIAKALTLPLAQSWREREIHLRPRSNALDPLWGGYVHHLRASGRLKEALRELEFRLAQVPLSAKAKTYVAVLHMQLGNHEDARLLFNEAVELWPDNVAARWFRFVNLAFYGSADDALHILAHESNKSDIAAKEVECWRTFIGARRTSRPDVAAVVKACADDSIDYVTRMLAALGDTHGAYESMRSGRFLEWNDSTVALFYPEMKSVRHDRRFMSLIADSGLVEYWATTGEWPDFCSDKDLPYACKDAATEVLKRTNRSARIPD